MRRRRILQTAGIATATLLSPASALAQNNGKGHGSDLPRNATLLDLSASDVVERIADPDASNFNEEFTYYRIDHDITYDDSVYREPARSGPEPYDLGSSSSGSFWLGVSGPDGDGIQHPIDHQGTVRIYLRDADTGEWYEIRATFDGNGDLVRVNNVKL